MRHNVRLDQFIYKHISERRWPWLFGGMSITFLLGCPLVLVGLCLISMLVNSLLAWQVAGMSMVRPAYPVGRPTVIVVVSGAATPTPLPTATATGILPPPTPTPGPATATPHPLDEYTIDKLRSRVYPGGSIVVRSVVTETAHFTAYYIEYPSDGLTITGVMQIPKGQGPFPAIILNHGYIPRTDYWPGADTWRAAGYLNQHGYLTIAPDYRSWGESDTDNSFFSTGQLIDTLNLISSLDSIPEADVHRVGMWGHSMGAGVAMKAITIDYRIRAAVLYAPVSADDAQVLNRWGPGCRRNAANPRAEVCAGAEVLVANMDDSLFWAYAEAVGDHRLLARTSPINYADYVIAPVQIHIGTADTRTPPQWAEDINERLRAAGKTVEYYTYPGQGHALTGESWQRFMERTVNFFDHCLTAED